MKRIFICALVAAFAPFVASAETLKITDSVGLTRVISEMSAPTHVEIKVSEPHCQVTLINIDGLKPDRTASADAQGVAHFQGVDHGTWKITLESTTARLMDVQARQQ